MIINYSCCCCLSNYLFYICHQLITKKIEIMTPQEINTLENKAFRLECEILTWRRFRTEVESFIQMSNTFGTNTDAEYKVLEQELEKIKYL